MDFQDRQINCLDCAQPFVFTAGEQEFYHRKGFREEPKRCKPCREARKNRRNGAPAGSGSWPASNDADDGNGRGNFRASPGEVDDDIGNRIGPPAGGGGGGGMRGNPRGPREVRDVGGGGGRSRGGGGGGAPREMFDAVCASCGSPTRVPFRPVAGRPVYCRDCYSANQGA